LKCKSGWFIHINKLCIASIGHVSNIDHKFDKFKKAGNVINLGWRPKVRGIAMNPNDHPHGGGEGKKSKPRNPRSPWGWFTNNGTPSDIKKYKLLKKKKFKVIK